MQKRHSQHRLRRQGNRPSETWNDSTDRRNRFHSPEGGPVSGDRKGRKTYKQHDDDSQRMASPQRRSFIDRFAHRHRMCDASGKQMDHHGPDSVMPDKHRHNRCGRKDGYAEPCRAA